MKEGGNLFELVIDQEEDRRQRAVDDAMHAVELRPVSARINVTAYEVLERLSERWGISRSALAAKLLESALWDVDAIDLDSYREVKGSES